MQPETTQRLSDRLSGDGEDYSTLFKYKPDFSSSPPCLPLPGFSPALLMRIYGVLDVANDLQNRPRCVDPDVRVKRIGGSTSYAGPKEERNPVEPSQGHLSSDAPPSCRIVPPLLLDAQRRGMPARGKPRVATGWFWAECHADTAMQ